MDKPLGLGRLPPHCDNIDGLTPPSVEVVKRGHEDTRDAMSSNGPSGETSAAAADASR